MGIMKEELFVELATNKEHPMHRMFVNDLKTCLFTINWARSGGQRGYVYNDEFDFSVDRDAALKAYEQALNLICERGRLNAKGMRPYVYQNLRVLDRSQPWWGFEFETGYNSREERAECLKYAWDIAELGVSFDGEGEGSYPSEVTFAPIEMSRVLDETAPASKFIKYLSDNKYGFNSNETYIGTHFNFSVPDRGYNLDNMCKMYANIECVINNTLHMVKGDRNALFGRTSIYGGASWRSMDNQSWVEIKLFRTTYDYETFKKYVQVCHALTRIALEVGSDMSDAVEKYCSNFEEMVENPELAPVFDTSSELTGSYEGYYVSGGSDYRYEDDYYDDEEVF